MEKNCNTEVFMGCYYEVAEQISKLVEGKKLDHYTIVKLQDEIENYIKRYGDTFNIDILEDVVGEKLEEKSYSNAWAFVMGGLATIVGLVGLIPDVQNGRTLLIAIVVLVGMIGVFIPILKERREVLEVRRRYLPVRISIRCIKRRKQLEYR